MKHNEEIEFDVEDPRFSAYALGELEGDDKRVIEALLAKNARAREFVEELRATAAAVASELAVEPAPALTDAQRAAIAARSRRAPVLSRSRWLWVGAAAAGLLAVSAIAFFQQMKRGYETQRSEVAMLQPQGASTRGGELRGLGYLGDRPGAAAANPSATPAVPGTFTGPGDSVPPGIAEVSTEAFVVGRIENEELGMHEMSAGESTGGTAIGVGAPGAKAYGGRAPASRRAGMARQREALQPYPQNTDIELVTPDDVAHNTEGYNPIAENAFKLTSADPLSTFSIDVDTASYSNVRRFLNQGQLPPADAVRVEELLNYFRFEYPKPDGEAPFSTSATVATCPWAPAHKLVQVGLRAQDVDLTKRQPSNLVFLIDVSGSMDQPDKLPLLVRSMKLLVQQLDGRDRIAMVVYAGASGVVLPPTTGDYQAVIQNALDGLQAGGSTNGGAGIELAYKLAADNFVKEGQNRVILCTDGDFNVGVTDQGSLVRMIEEKRQTGVFLSVLGFGTGNTKDSTMEMLADKGNGSYAYIDTLNEARKVLVSEVGGTLFTVAKDVKLQLEFNPAEVQAWRLIGYENRVLAHQDFNDDKKDAGEIGAGHTVTALYEIVPVGVPFQGSGVDPLKYQETTRPTSAARSGELLHLKLRYKAPDGDTSKLLETPVRDPGRGWQEASPDFKFASAVAGFGLVLRKSAHVGSFSMNEVLHLALQGIGEDVGGYRKEFVELVRKAQAIAGKQRVK